MTLPAPLLARRIDQPAALLAVPEVCLDGVRHGAQHRGCREQQSVRLPPEATPAAQPERMAGPGIPR